MNSRKPKDVLEDALEALGASEGELEALVLAMSEAKRTGGPESLRARLMQSLMSTHRFDALEATVASLLDVDASTAARFLQKWSIPMCSKSPATQSASINFGTLVVMWATPSWTSGGSSSWIPFLQKTSTWLSP